MKKTRRFLPLASIFLITTSLASPAADYRYTGNGSESAPTTGNWNVAGNWLDGEAPVSSLDNVFFFGGSGTGSYTSSNNIGTNFALNRVVFDSTSTGVVTINSGSLNFLQNSSASGPRITQSGSGEVTLNLGIALSDTLTIDGTGTGQLNFNYAITGTGGITLSGNRTVVFGQGTNNTYTGLTTVSAGLLELRKTHTNFRAIGGDLLVNGGTVRLFGSSQIATTSAVNITNGGTLDLGGNTNVINSLSLSSTSAAAPAVLNLGNQTNSVGLTINSGDLTFGENTRIEGNGFLRRNGGPLVLNFNGGQIGEGSSVITGHTTTGTVINITQGLGSGRLLLGANGATTTTTVNLDYSGSINLGALAIAQSNPNTTTNPNSINVNIANTATGLSGGGVTTVNANDADDPTGPARILVSGTTTLTFEAGGSGFNLSGGILDVRSNATAAAAGVITTNGNNLTISGGALFGNRLNATTGSITLTAGHLALTDVRSATPVHYAISNTAGNDGHTITMTSGSTGAFSVGTATNTTSYITIGAQDDFGTWDRGYINAGRNYYITANTTGASAFSGISAYTIGDNSGLIGLDLGAGELPTQLYLGNNSGFFVSNSTAGARIFNVGSDFTNEVVVNETGGFSFGVNNTNANNAQVINLLRDKGDSDIALLSNGTSNNNTININVDQTGSGMLYASTARLVIAEGVSFTGTGGISTDPTPGNGLEESIVGGPQVHAHGAFTRDMDLIVQGTLGDNFSLIFNPDAATHRRGSITLEATARVEGAQNWTLSGGGTNHQYVYRNELTDASRFSDNVAITFGGTAAEFETTTNATTPGASSNYKLASLHLSGGINGTTGGFRLVNQVQNDGGSGKEALYTSSFRVSGGYTDSSNGRHLFNLNGQDFYVDRFDNVTGTQMKGFVLVNDAAGTLSRFQAVETTGDTLNTGSFLVINGATLEVAGGDYNALVFNRNTGTIVGDSAAAPNYPNNLQNTTVKQTQNWDGTSANVGTYTFFLGSGTEAGTNTVSTGRGTDGTFRLLGGDFATSGYVLNPIGTNGLFDTTGEGDTTLNTVLIRGNTATDINGVGNDSTYPAFVVGGTTTLVGHLTLEGAEGAYRQSTLRVGGVTASLTPSALGSATLNIAGNLSVGATNNLAIQSNATVRVGGNVSIQGIGVAIERNVTGTGVGIHQDSRFILNGGGAAQGVDIVTSVGQFHVGDGADGVLSGNTAHARLDANLSAHTVSVNGVLSRLDLNGRTLSINNGGGQLTVGGTLSGSGTVDGDARFLTGSNHSIGNSPGLQTITGDTVYDSGSFFSWELEANAAAITLQVGAPVFDQLQVGGLLEIASGAQIALTFNGAESSVDFTNAFWGEDQSWLVAQAGALSGIWSLGAVGADSLGNLSNTYGYFTLSGTSEQLHLNWTAQAIPEPGTSTLLVGISLGSLYFLRRRRNSR